MSAGRKKTLRWALVLLAGSVVLLLTTWCLARVGGGSGFGGSGGGGEGGGDGGGGDLIALLIYLAIRYPHVGVPLLVVGVIVMVSVNKAKQKEVNAKGIKAAHMSRLGQATRTRKKVNVDMKKLEKDDPNFSEILFLDFAQMIYARFQEARGSSQLDALRVYLSDELIARLEEAAKRFTQVKFQVHSVIVGSISLTQIASDNENWQIECEIESNYTESKTMPGKKQTDDAYYARTRLTFVRAKGVLSKGPDQIRSLGCPSCGSPMKVDHTGVCAYCGQGVRPGEFHWELFTIKEFERRPFEEMPLDAGGEEIGTDFPTVRDTELSVQAKSFAMRYPGENLQHVVDRAKEVFETLQRAWTTGKWEQARAFETDRLFQVHTFWMESYKYKKLRNVIDQVKVLRITIAKLGRDAFYELATLRIKATMLDYTLDAEGKVVAGSNKKARVFSEYWTFIRRAGFEPGKELNSASCPSCGAPTKVSMHGRCEYCDANLSSGDFDWTLAKIEQDEVYVG